MAYGTKYRMQFNEVRRGNQTTVDIKQKDYSSTVTDINGGDDPVHIKYIESVNARDPVFAPIKKSEATLSVVSSSDFQYQDMFINSNTKDHLIAIYRGTRADEIIQNRNFIGSLEGWTASNMVWDEDTAKMDNTTGTGQLIQTTNHPSDGSYTVHIYYANAAIGERVNTYYDNILKNQYTTTKTFGSFTVNYTTSGSPKSTIKITKDWPGATSVSNMRFKEIGITPLGGTTYDYNLIWKGWHNPRLYSEPLKYQPYISQITATCGIGILGNTDFKDGDTWFKNQHTLLQVVIDCIDQMEIYLPIKINLNIYDNVSMSDGEDPFDTLYVDYARFRDDQTAWTYYDVLESILKPFGVRMYQSEGYWVIERIANKLGTYYAYVYDWYGNELDGSLECDDIKALTLKGANENSLAIYRGQQQFIESEDNWKNIDMVQDTGHRLSIIRGDFDEIWWSSATSLINWTKGGSIDIERHDNAVRITGMEWEPIPAPSLTNKLTYLPAFGSGINYGYGHIGSGTLKFSTRAVTIAPLLATPIMRLSVYYTYAGGYWFLNQSTGIFTKTTYDNPFWITTTYGDQVESDSGWIDVEINIEAQRGIHGNLYVELYEAYLVSPTSPPQANDYSWYEIKNINLYIEGMGIKDSIESKNTINANNYKKPNKNEFKIGDIQKDVVVFNNASMLGLYSGLLVNENQVPTSAGWQQWATSARLDLIHELLAGDMAKQYKYNRQILNAFIFGGNITFDTVIMDTNNSGRPFLSKTVDISLKHQTAGGSWVELYYPSLDTDPVAGDFDKTDFEPTDFLTDP